MCLSVIAVFVVISFLATQLPKENYAYIPIILHAFRTCLRLKDLSLLLIRQQRQNGKSKSECNDFPLFSV